MSKVLHDDNDYAQAIAIPRVFSQISRAYKNKHKKTIYFSDGLEMKYNTAESDRQLLVTELTRLREQYEDLIKQMEQTQAIIDKQQVIS